MGMPSLSSFDKDQNITSDKRIKAALPTIKYLIDKGAILILASHLGRPKGEVKKEMSLSPVQKKLAELLGKEVKMAPDCIGDEVKKLRKERNRLNTLIPTNVCKDCGKKMIWKGWKCKCKIPKSVSGISGE